MLTRLKIDNFKSLSEFSLPSREDESLPSFVCLIGLNGSGKSTVLQAIDFLSQLVVGQVDSWLSARKWERSQLLSKTSRKRTISFQMEFEDYFGKMKWSGSYNVLEGKCVSEDLEFIKKDESLKILRTNVFNYEKGIIKDSFGGRIELTSDFHGSVFGSLRLSALDKSDALMLILLRSYLQGVKSLELLAPSAMRAPSREAVDVGLGGERLAAFINGLSGKEKKKLLEELSNFYPRLKKITTDSAQFGWRRVKISELFNSEYESDARHINDGLLRLAAILAQTIAQERYRRELEKNSEEEDLGNPGHRGYQLILLEEIENGINPELVQRLVKYLVSVRQQVFVTTHSPLILNYLDDDQAKKSVFLLFRRKNGSVGATRFFDIPAVASRLELMGAGEAYLDVGLEKLSDELSSEGVV
jgi:ABC-type oligopeptide transport system ATPase subunit